jgi:hypothetical protein
MKAVIGQLEFYEDIYCNKGYYSSLQVRLQADSAIASVASCKEKFSGERGIKGSDLEESLPRSIS